MNILILSWRGPDHPNAGGAELVTQEHAKAWVRAGHKVTLFTSHFKNAERERVVDKVLVKRWGYQFFGVQIAAFWWYLFGKHPKFDLVVDHFHGIPFFSPFYVRVKKLAFIHEVTKEVWFLYPWPKPYNCLAGIIGYLFEPLIFKFLYREIPFITVSNSTKQDLVVFGIKPSNIWVIENGVHILKTQALKAKKKTAIYLGAFAKDKGIEDALKIFAAIKQKETGWQFWAAGKSSPEYFKKLKILARKLEIESEIKFWGFVSERKKFGLLAKAHVLINPSIREGWGLVNIEANAMGTPVVGYNVPGLRDSIVNAKTGFLVSAGNIEEAATFVCRLVKNNVSYKNFQKNCLAWSRKFTWKNSSEKSLKLINSLVE